ncbi:hypothetical protein FE257_005958, partial [Aspergillus nanangensis]
MAISGLFGAGQQQQAAHNEGEIPADDTIAGQGSWLLVHMDGSGINDEIEAAAICPQHQETRTAYVDEQSGITIYTAGLQRTFLGLICTKYGMQCTAFTGNPVRSMSHTEFAGQSGHHLLEACI